MDKRINSYYAMLIITIVGSGAALLIIHVANRNSLEGTVNGSEAQYSALQQSILQ